jgi:hypothetical protein
VFSIHVGELFALELQHVEHRQYRLQAERGLWCKWRSLIGYADG